MKTCLKCTLAKDLSAFNNDKRKKDGKAPWCRDCSRAYHNAYYRANPVRQQQVQADRKASTQRCREFVWNFLSAHPCVDCGESDPIVLEFDHVRGVKRDSISMLVLRTSVATVAREIEKCEVRCANCHRRVTHQRGGWWRGP